MKYSIGELVWSRQHKKEAKILSSSVLWDKTSYEIIIPEEKEILWVQEEALKELQTGDQTTHHIGYLAAAAKIQDTLGQNVLVSPFEAPVIPLPHQLKCLSRAMEKDTVRYLLADEVGLGKTIEAGLILRELKSRGLVKRILIVTPTGLAYQWVAEMKTKFAESFHLLQPQGFSQLRNSGFVEDDQNVWEVHNQVICTLDSVKPLEARKGWSQEKVDEYNQERFDSLVSANWDLIIIDEAHRLGGSADTVARFKLGEGLSNATPYLLLLSATPHQGKSDAFCRLMSFLDKETFSDEGNISHTTVRPYVIRTEKRLAIDSDGKPLFNKRQTKLISSQWGEADVLQCSLYNSLTDYIRLGYNKAQSEKQTAYGFLMVLFQRMVLSSTRAIRRTLERRLELLKDQKNNSNQIVSMNEEWNFEDDFEDQVDLLSLNLKELEKEIQEVELLVNLARDSENQGPDRKFYDLISIIHKKQQEEESIVKILIFTEFVATQDMLKEYLTERGFSIATLNGSMDMDERKAAIRHFADQVQILVSTEAGGEGLNMQFCHAVINYDIPWNPMKLEQRIGRIDRIGQSHPVEAYNLTIADTVEDRVREVVEIKLEKILHEYGADKLSDVLDSESSNTDFNKLYTAAIVDESTALQDVDKLIAQIKRIMSQKRHSNAVLGSTGSMDPGIAREIEQHPIGFWIKQMVMNYLRWNKQNNARIEEGKTGYNIYWPDGDFSEEVTFDRVQSDTYSLDLLSLESSIIQQLLEKSSPRPNNNSLPVVIIPEVSNVIEGIWSLWQVTLYSDTNKLVRYFPLFESKEGKFFKPSAEKIWNTLISGKAKFMQDVKSVDFENSECKALDQGQQYYQLLQTKHEELINRKMKSKELLFSARQRAIKQIGLQTVRNHRQKQLNLEVEAWQEELVFLKSYFSVCREKK
ncbi:MAG: hypothetical protein B6241_08610 [Spirochaetaceae bacterium 4572_59]|nr:MAG: hypothetical protein B6241_08610 [Spirochaetaceae bacterium 4572_59]